jgi:glycogen synthase
MEGIPNGLYDIRFIDLSGDIREYTTLIKLKSDSKKRIQQRYGLMQGSEHKLLTFLGRITHQKGCDIIARAAPEILEFDNEVQLVIAGPIGDHYGLSTLKMVKKLCMKYPGRVANRVGAYISGSEKQELTLACDFFLCPSRYAVFYGHYHAHRARHKKSRLIKILNRSSQV